MNYKQQGSIDFHILDVSLNSPEFLDNLTPEYRTHLFKVQSERFDSEMLNKTQEMANLYNLAKQLKVPMAVKSIRDILDLPMTTVERRVYMARHAGLIATKNSGNQE